MSDWTTDAATKKVRMSRRVGSWRRIFRGCKSLCGDVLRPPSSNQDGTSEADAPGQTTEYEILKTLLAENHPNISCSHIAYTAEGHVQGLDISWDHLGPPDDGVASSILAMETICGFNRIQEFRLQSCPYLSLPKMIQQMTALTSLTLEEIPFLSKELGCLKNLESLELVNCGYIAAGIRNLTRLKKISIRYNGPRRLSSFEDFSVLKRINTLESLSLSGLPEIVIFLFGGESWDGNSSLKQIDLSNCRIFSLRGLLRSLPPSLEELRLDNNEIRDLEGFVTAGLPKGIRRLCLASNPVLQSTSDCQQQYLTRLLNLYPQLGHICDPSEFYKPLLYKLLSNRSGRLLLEDSKPIPLSMWPVVLELAANSGHPSRQKSRRHASRSRCHNSRFVSASSTASLVFVLVRAYPIWVLTST